MTDSEASYGQFVVDPARLQGPTDEEILTTVNDWVSRISDLIPPGPRLARVEMGPIALDALKRVADQPALGLPVARLGTPITNLPADVGHPCGCCWRGIATDGTVMGEGCVIRWSEPEITAAGMFPANDWLGRERPSKEGD